MAYVMAPVSCGHLSVIPDYSAALALPGVIGAVDWRDVPGSLMISHFGDVPVFVRDKVSEMKRNAIKISRK